MKNHKVHLQYSNACYCHDKIWFVEGETNSLFTMVMPEMSVYFRGKIPFIEEEIKWAYAVNIHCHYDSKLFFFPSNCRQIAIYDIKKEEIQILPILPMDNTGAYITAGIVQNEHYVWIFPYKLTQGIFRLDLDTLELERNAEFDETLKDVEYICNYDNIIRINETDLAILSGKHTIIGVNIQEKKRTFTKCFDEEIDIWGIRYDGNSFWLLLYNVTDIYEWIPAEDRLVKYQLQEEEWIDGRGGTYVNMIFRNDQIIVLPCCLKYIMRIDRETRRIYKAAEYPPQFCFLRSLSQYPAFGAFDMIESQKIILHPLRGNMLLSYDMEKNRIEGKELVIGGENIRGLKPFLEQQLQNKYKIIYETETFGAEMLDLFICSGTAGAEDISEKRIGKSIYNTLK